MKVLWCVLMAALVSTRAVETTFDHSEAHEEISDFSDIVPKVDAVEIDSVCPPTRSPTQKPVTTCAPTQKPVAVVTSAPTQKPVMTCAPTQKPVAVTTSAPTQKPVMTCAPTLKPVTQPAPKPVPAPKPTPAPKPGSGEGGSGEKSPKPKPVSGEGGSGGSGGSGEKSPKPKPVSGEGGSGEKSPKPKPVSGEGGSGEKSPKPKPVPAPKPTPKPVSNPAPQPAPKPSPSPPVIVCFHLNITLDSCPKATLDKPAQDALCHSVADTCGIPPSCFTYKGCVPHGRRRLTDRLRGPHHASSIEPFGKTTYVLDACGDVCVELDLKKYKSKSDQCGQLKQKLDVAIGGAQFDDCLHKNGKSCGSNDIQSCHGSHTSCSDPY